MLSRLRAWIETRKHLRQAWRDDAGALIAQNEKEAYYVAQRLAARARARRENELAWHWAKVASEIARRSPIAEMDWQVVKQIAAEEDGRADRTPPNDRG